MPSLIFLHGDLFNSEFQNKNAFSDFLKYDVMLVPTKEDINKYIDDVDEIKSRTDKLLNKIK